MEDAEELVDDLDEYQWIRMREMGASEEEITRAKVHKQRKEDVSLYTLIIKQRAWSFDESCSFTDAYLRLCSALEGLVRRPEAILKLYEALGKQPNNPQIMLALAKLLFKDDQKDASLALCNGIFAMYACRGSQASNDEDGEDVITISADDAADSYYLGGWVKIHDDDHTNAYRIWKEGHLAVPGSELLATQFRKRACWDEPFTATDPRVSHLVGSSSGHCGEPYDLSNDFDSFVCYDPHAGKKKVKFTINGEEEKTYVTPALAIFDAAQAQRGLVFRSKRPVLTPEECESVVEIVNRHHEDSCGGAWSTVRHSSVKTTDVAVESVPLLREWLLALMHTKVHTMLSFLYPVLADGSTLYASETPGNSRIRIHDAFIVRYDAEKDKSLSLPEHCDTSAISMVVSLNSAAEGHYTGGGTWFEALGPKGVVVDAEVGQAVAFAGPLKHAGYPTTQGTRMILVLFLYVEGYHYGPYLTKAAAQCASCHAEAEEDRAAAPKSKIENLSAVAARPSGGGVSQDSTVTVDNTQKLNSGGDKGGFVVYRQTVDLVNMLEKPMVRAPAE